MSLLDSVMYISIDEQLYERLAAIAQQRGQPTEHLITQILEQYLAQCEKERRKFSTRIHRHMDEHAWLLDQLARH